MVNRPLANAQNCGPMTKHAGRKCICSPAYYWSSEHHAIPFDQSESGSQWLGTSGLLRGPQIDNMAS